LHEKVREVFGDLPEKLQFFASLSKTPFVPFGAFQFDFDGAAIARTNESERAFS
jgi:hypothetical protein